MDDSLGLIKSRRPTAATAVAEDPSDVDRTPAAHDEGDEVSKLPQSLRSLSLVEDAGDGRAESPASVREGTLSKSPSPAPLPSTQPDAITSSHLESLFSAQAAQLRDLQVKLQVSEERLAAQTRSSAEHCTILETALQETEERLERETSAASERADEAQTRAAEQERLDGERIVDLERQLQAARALQEEHNAATRGLEEQARQRDAQFAALEAQSTRLSTRYERAKGEAGQALAEKATAAWELLAGAAWSEACVVDEQMDMCRILLHDLDMWERSIVGS